VALTLDLLSIITVAADDGANARKTLACHQYCCFLAPLDERNGINPRETAK
jgi:hypothetical protein